MSLMGDHLKICLQSSTRSIFLCHLRVLFWERVRKNTLYPYMNSFFFSKVLYLFYVWIVHIDTAIPVISACSINFFCTSKSANFSRPNLFPEYFSSCNLWYWLWTLVLIGHSLHKVLVIMANVYLSVLCASTFYMY